MLKEAGYDDGCHEPLLDWSYELQILAVMHPHNRLNALYNLTPFFVFTFNKIFVLFS